MQQQLSPDRTRRLAEESVPRLILTFSLPAIVGMMASALYNIVDGIYVGKRIGTDALAGITLAFPFMLVLLAFGMLVGFGAAALVSIRLGEGKKDDAERVLGSAIPMLILMSLIITPVGVLLLDPLLKLLTPPGSGAEAALPFARQYLGIIIYGTIFQIVGFGLNAVIRGEGNPKIAMLTLLIGVGLNSILAWIFVFPLNWGMKGAATATLISQAVSAAWVLGYFFSGKSHVKIRRRYLLPDWRVCLKILLIGSPMFFMQMANCVMNGVLYRQLAHWGGALAIAVMGVIWRWLMVITMPVFGINQGVQPIIGFNHGAKRFDRVRKTLVTAILFATSITVVGFSVAMLCPGPVFRMFVGSDDPNAVEMLKLGIPAMRVALMMLPLIGFQVISASYFQAVGKPQHAMLLMLSRQVLLLIPAILILPRFFALEGIWMSLPVADCGSSLLTAVWLTWELRHLDARHLAAKAAAAEIPADEAAAFEGLPWTEEA